MPKNLIANRYQPLQVLGQGAMGLVTLARDLTTGSEVALKVFSNRKANAGSTDPGETFRQSAAEKSTLQFRQEFQLMTRLRHPNCCAVYDYGLSAKGEPFFTMEVVPGHGLDELLEPSRGGLPPERFTALFAQLLRALGYIHQQGFVHLDVKAANVRVTPDGTLKLMDYGLMDYAGQGAGVIRGTLPYISPEMARRAPVDRRSDLYSAGILAYELLTGRLPFVRASAVETLRAHLVDRPEPPSRLWPGIPEALDRLVMRLLAKEPLERFQSAEDVLDALGVETPPGLGGSLLTSPMVGRDAEVARLDARLVRLKADGAGGTVHLRGMAGLGKSRLLDELRVRVQLAHVPFGRAQCESGGLPGASLIGLLRGLLPALRQELPGLLAETAPVLVRLLPELAVAPAPTMESPRHEVLRLQAVVAELLKALAARVPLVLALEDWQRADELAKDTLAFLRRNLVGQPVLWLLASRAADGDEAAWEPPAEALALEGLAPPAVERMLASMLGSDRLPMGFLDAVMRVTAGNPLYVERLLDHLVRSAALVRRQGRWLAELDLAGLDLGTSLPDLLLEKLDELSADARLVGLVAALYGHPAGIDFLQAATGLAELAMFDALGALQRQHILVMDAQGAYVFAQQHYRDGLVARLEERQRVGLHRTIAEVLLGMAGDRPPSELGAELVMAIATHAREGGRRAEALRFGLEAGRRAVTLFALGQAEAFLAAGLERLAPTDDEKALRYEHLRLLGEVKRQAGLGQEAVSYLQDAARLAEELGETRELGPLLTNLGKAQLMQAQYEAALAALTRSAETCLAHHDESGAARALLAASRTHFFQGRVSTAKELADAALARATAGGERAILGQTYAFLGYLMVAAEPERLAEGVGFLEHAVAILEELGDRVGLNDTYNLLGNAQTMLGDLDRASHSFEVCERICRENGLREEESLAAVNLAITAIERGEYATARGHAAHARALAEQVDGKLPLGMALVLAGVAAAYLGELADAETPALAALALAREMANRYLEAAVLARWLELQVVLGRIPEALATADELEQLIARTGNTEPQGPLLAWKALALAHAGRPNEALASAEEARALARRTSAKSLLALASRAAALAAVGREDWDRARSVAEEGLATATQAGARAEAAELHALLGECALAVGDGRAGQHFAHVLALAEEAGAPELAAIARFGLAAAEPYRAQATALAARARDALLALAAELPEASRAAYLGTRARQRAVAGEVMAFSLPRQRRRASTGPLGMGWGAL